MFPTVSQGAFGKERWGDIENVPPVVLYLELPYIVLTHSKSHILPYVIPTNCCETPLRGGQFVCSPVPNILKSL